MMSGLVVVDGSVSQSAGATAHGGLLVVHGDAAARCGISMKGVDIVVRGSVGHLSAFMAQTGNLVVCGDAGDALGDSIYEARLYVRGSVAGLGADCIEKEMRDGARRAGARAARAGRHRRRRSRRRSGATARRASSTTSRSTTRGRTDERRLAARAARVGALRPQRDRGDPARREGGHLRHSRLRRQAEAAALRRPALPRRERLPLPARGVPRALRHERHARHALREEAARAEDSGHDRRDELRRALRAGEGGARARCDRDGHLDDDGRRRHDPRGARPLGDARLSAAALALRHEPRRPPQGRRDRGRRRPGREAGRRRDAARPQDLRPRGRDARPAEGDRPAQRLPPSRLDGAGRPRDQDRRAARDHRLAEADLRQGRRHAHLLRRAARGEGRCRRDRRRRHAGRHGGDAGRLHRARRDPDTRARSRSPCRRSRSSASTARCS